MIRCYITDRRTTQNLLEAIARNLLKGVEYIQIREKDLGARELVELVRRTLALPNLCGTRILVNGRVDVAMGAGAAGVHLSGDSIAPDIWRAIAPAGFIIGVSCHSLDDVLRAEREGADHVVFGPVFAPISKHSELPPRGLDELRRVSRAVRIPVLALGGITEDNTAACVEAGAAGVAGISLFQNC